MISKNIKYEIANIKILKFRWMNYWLLLSKNWSCKCWSQPYPYFTQLVWWAVPATQHWQSGQQSGLQWALPSVSLHLPGPYLQLNTGSGQAVWATIQRPQLLQATVEPAKQVQLEQLNLLWKFMSKFTVSGNLIPHCQVISGFNVKQRF